MADDVHLLDIKLILLINIHTLHIVVSQIEIRIFKIRGMYWKCLMHSLYCAYTTWGAFDTWVRAKVLHRLKIWLSLCNTFARTPCTAPILHEVLLILECAQKCCIDWAIFSGGKFLCDSQIWWQFKICLFISNHEHKQIIFFPFCCV